MNWLVGILFPPNLELEDSRTCAKVKIAWQLRFPLWTWSLASPFYPIGIYVRGVIYYDESMESVSDSGPRASCGYSQSDNTEYLEVTTQEIEGLIVRRYVGVSIVFVETSR